MVSEASATATESADNNAASAGQDAVSEMCVIDLGEHSRRAVKRLRRGEGRLMDKVEDTILSLQQEEIIEASAQVVVVVVREEDQMISFFDDDDDDDDDD